MAIQSGLFIFIFVLVGLILLGLIVFLALYYSRSSKKPQVKERAKSLSAVDQKYTNGGAEEDGVDDISFTKLVSMGRAIKNDQFAILFDDEWIEEPSQLSFIQRNRLEKNLAEAQEWLIGGIQPMPVPPAKIKEDAPAAVVAPLAPLKNPEKHQRQKSIVEQVDEILQDLLESNPIQGKNIRLMEMPDKGVIVWVENENFDGIDAVPDEEVKQMIKQAVKQWEKSSGT